jgi:Fe-S-cluster-containing dehydrogenase component
MKIKRRDFLKVAAGGGILLAAQGPSNALARGEKKALPANARGILYDSTLCIGCMSCMVGCKKANNMPIDPTDTLPLWDNPKDLSAKTLNVIKKYSQGTALNKDQETNGYAFIKRHCMHCLDPSCVSACPVSALTKNPDTGVVTYNKKACIGCRYCQIACPFNIPKFQWDSPVPEITKCQLCNHLLEKGGISACCSSCPTGASLFGPVEALLAEAKRRLTLEPGTYENFPVSSIGASQPEQYQSHKVGHYQEHIYGENEVGGTQVLLMAGVPFGKLGLPDLPDESFVSLANGIQYAIYKGMGYPLVVLGALIYMVRRGGSHIEEEG